MRTIVIGTFFLLVSAAPALASEADKEDAKVIAGIMLIPAALVLLALPLAVVFRISAKLPTRIAGTLAERPYVSVLLGAGNLLLLVLISVAAKDTPATAVVASILWIIFFVIALIGMTGAAANLASRLGRPEGAGGFTLAWLLMAGLSLFPYLGLLYLLWLATGGVGGTLLTFYGGRRAA